MRRGQHDLHADTKHAVRSPDITIICLSLPAHPNSQSEHSLGSPDLVSTNQRAGLFLCKIEICQPEQCEEGEEREVVISRAIMAKLR